MNLGELIVELSADYGSLEEQLDQARLAAEQAAMFIENQFKSRGISVDVDHEPLTDLNEHLALKVQHLEQVNKYFKNNPIKPIVDTSELENLDQLLSQSMSSGQQKSIQTKLVIDTSDIERVQRLLSGISDKTVTVKVQESVTTRASNNSTTSSETKSNTTENQVNVPGISVDVDHRSLTELNEHLALKVQHLEQVNKYFSNNPIRPIVDISELDTLNQLLAQSTTGGQQRTIEARLSIDASDLDRIEGLISGLDNRTISIRLEETVSNRSSSSTRTETRTESSEINSREIARGVGQALREDRSETRGSGKGSTSIQDAILGNIKDHLKSVIGKVTSVVTKPLDDLSTGFFEGFTHHFGDALAQGLQDSLSQHLDFDFQEVGENIGTQLLHAFGFSTSEQNLIERGIESVRNAFTGAVTELPRQARELASREIQSRVHELVERQLHQIYSMLGMRSGGGSRGGGGSGRGNPPSGDNTSPSDRGQGRIRYRGSRSGTDSESPDTGGLGNRSRRGLRFNRTRSNGSTDPDTNQPIPLIIPSSSGNSGRENAPTPLPELVSRQSPQLDYVEVNQPNPQPERRSNTVDFKYYQDSSGNLTEIGKEIKAIQRTAQLFNQTSSKNAQQNPEQIFRELERSLENIAKKIAAEYKNLPDQKPTKLSETKGYVQINEEFIAIAERAMSDVEKLVLHNQQLLNAGKQINSPLSQMHAKHSSKVGTYRSSIDKRTASTKSTMNIRLGRVGMDQIPDFTQVSTQELKIKELELGLKEAQAKLDKVYAEAAKRRETGRTTAARQPTAKQADMMEQAPNVDALAEEVNRINTSVQAGIEQGLNLDDMHSLGLDAGFSILAGLRTALQIQSPSKQTMKDGINLMKGLGLGITQGYGLVTGALGKLLQIIKDFFLKVSTSLNTDVNKMIANTVGAISKGASAVSGFASSALQGGTKGQKQRTTTGTPRRYLDASLETPKATPDEPLTVKSAIESGKNIVAGMTSGIKNKDTAVKVVKNLAESVINAANQTLEIKSPSKKFEKIGQMVVAGFVKGMSAYMTGGSSGQMFAQWIESASRSSLVMGRTMGKQLIAGMVPFLDSLERKVLQVSSRISNSVKTSQAILPTTPQESTNQDAELDTETGTTTDKKLTAGKVAVGVATLGSKLGLPEIFVEIAKNIDPALEALATIKDELVGIADKTAGEHIAHIAFMAGVIENEHKDMVASVVNNLINSKIAGAIAKPVKGVAKTALAAGVSSGVLPAGSELLADRDFAADKKMVIDYLKNTSPGQMIKSAIAPGVKRTGAAIQSILMMTQQSITKELAKVGTQSGTKESEINAAIGNLLRNSFQFLEDMDVQSLVVEKIIGLAEESGDSSMSAEQIESAIKEQLESMTSAINGGTSSGAVETGENVGLGVIEGLESSESDVAKSGIDLANTLLNSFRKRLGIQSPSREFARIARFITLGLKTGLTQQNPEMIRLFTELASQMFNVSQREFRQLPRFINEINALLANAQLDPIDIPVDGNISNLAEIQRHLNDLMPDIYDVSLAINDADAIAELQRLRQNIDSGGRPVPPNPPPNPNPPPRPDRAINPARGFQELLFGASSTGIQSIFSLLTQIPEGQANSDFAFNPLAQMQNGLRNLPQGFMGQAIKMILPRMMGTAGFDMGKVLTDILRSNNLKPGFMNDLITSVTGVNFAGAGSGLPGMLMELSNLAGGLPVAFSEIGGLSHFGGVLGMLMKMGGGKLGLGRSDRPVTREVIDKQLAENRERAELSENDNLADLIENLGTGLIGAVFRKFGMGEDSIVSPGMVTNVMGMMGSMTGIGAFTDVLNPAIAHLTGGVNLPMSALMGKVKEALGANKEAIATDVKALLNPLTRNVFSGVKSGRGLVNNNQQVLGQFQQAKAGDANSLLAIEQLLRNRVSDGQRAIMNQSVGIAPDADISQTLAKIYADPNSTQQSLEKLLQDTAIAESLTIHLTPEQIQKLGQALVESRPAEAEVMENFEAAQAGDTDSIDAMIEAITESLSNVEQLDLAAALGLDDSASVGDMVTAMLQQSADQVAEILGGIEVPDIGSIVEDMFADAQNNIGTASQDFSDALLANLSELDLAALRDELQVQTNEEIAPALLDEGLAGAQEAIRNAKESSQRTLSELEVAKAVRDKGMTEVSKVLQRIQGGKILSRGSRQIVDSLGAAKSGDMGAVSQLSQAISTGLTSAQREKLAEKLGLDRAADVSAILNETLNRSEEEITQMLEELGSFDLVSILEQYARGDTEGLTEQITALLTPGDVVNLAQSLGIEIDPADVESRMEEIVGLMMAAVSRLHGDFNEQGFDMVQQLIDGIRENAGNVQNAFDEIAYNAKKALGQATLGDAIGLVRNRIERGHVVSQDMFSEVFRQSGAAMRRRLMPDEPESERQGMQYNVAGFIVSMSTALAPISTMMASLAPLVMPLIPVITSVGAIAMMVVPYIGQLSQHIQTIQSMQRRMETVGGSKEAGKVEMEYVKGVADKFGMAIEPAAEAYAQISIAARGTKMEGENVKDLFEGVAASMHALGISGQDAGFVWTAYTQMIAKGKISMEELRQQLGEKFPPAIGMFAKALDVTTPELMTLIQQGSLLSEDVFPKVAKVLKEDYGSGATNTAGSLSGSFARIGNTMFEVMTKVSDAYGPILAGMVSFGDSVLKIFKDMLDGLIPVANSFIIGTAAVLFAGMAAILNTNPIARMMKTATNFMLASFSAIMSNLAPYFAGVFADVLDGVFGAQVGVMDNMMNGMTNLVVSFLVTLNNLQQSFGGQNWFQEMIGDIGSTINPFISAMKLVKDVFMSLFRALPPGIVEFGALFLMLQQLVILAQIAIIPTFKNTLTTLIAMGKSVLLSAKSFFSLGLVFKELALYTVKLDASMKMKLLGMLGKTAHFGHFLAAIKTMIASLGQLGVQLLLVYAIMGFAKGNFKDPLGESAGKFAKGINDVLRNIKTVFTELDARYVESLNKRNQRTETLEERAKNFAAQERNAKNIQDNIESLKPMGFNYKFWDERGWYQDDFTNQANRKVLENLEKSNKARVAKGLDQVSVEDYIKQQREMSPGRHGDAIAYSKKIETLSQKGYESLSGFDPKFSLYGVPDSVKKMIDATEHYDKNFSHLQEQLGQLNLTESTKGRFFQDPAIADAKQKAEEIKARSLELRARKPGLLMRGDTASLIEDKKINAELKELDTRYKELTKPLTDYAEQYEALKAAIEGNIKAIEQDVNEGKIAPGIAQELTEKLQESLKKLTDVAVDTINKLPSGELIEETYKEMNKRMKDATLEFERNERSRVVNRHKAEVSMYASNAPESAITGMQQRITVTDMKSEASNLLTMARQRKNALAQMLTIPNIDKGDTGKEIEELRNKVYEDERNLYRLASEIARAQREMNQQLINYTKQVVEFYRSIDRQVKGQIAEINKLRNTTASNQKTNQLRQLLVGGSDDIITQFIDGIIQTIESITELENSKIDSQERIRAIQEGAADQVNQGIELAKNIPGSDPVTIPVGINFGELGSEENVEKIVQALGVSLSVAKDLTSETDATSASADGVASSVGNVNSNIQDAIGLMTQLNEMFKEGAHLSAQISVQPGTIPTATTDSATAASAAAAVTPEKVNTVKSEILAGDGKKFATQEKNMAVVFNAAKERLEEVKKDPKATLKDYNQAIRALEYVMERTRHSPTQKDTARNIANLLVTEYTSDTYRKLHAKDAGQLPDIELVLQAMSIAESVIRPSNQIDEKKAQKLYEDGKKLAQQGNTLEALKKFSFAIQNTQDSTLSHNIIHERNNLLKGGSNRRDIYSREQYERQSGILDEGILTREINTNLPKALAAGRTTFPELSRTYKRRAEVRDKLGNERGAISDYLSAHQLADNAGKKEIIQKLRKYSGILRGIGQSDDTVLNAAYKEVSQEGSMLDTALNLTHGKLHGLFHTPHQELNPDKLNSEQATAHKMISTSLLLRGRGNNSILINRLSQLSTANDMGALTKAYNIVTSMLLLNNDMPNTFTAEEVQQLRDIRTNTFENIKKLDRNFGISNQPTSSAIPVTSQPMALVPSNKSTGLVGLTPIADNTLAQLPQEGVKVAAIASDVPMNLGIPNVGTSLVTDIIKDVPQMVARAQKQVHLTFDDGPNRKYTPQVLKHLANAGVKATFFILGKHIKGNEDLIRSIHQGGHTLANHTFSHPLNQLTPAQAKEEIEKTNAEIGRALGIPNWKAAVYRLPGGKRGTGVDKYIEQTYGANKILGWDVDAADWKKGITPNQITGNVMGGVSGSRKNNTTVLFHDGIGDTPDRLNNPALNIGKSRQATVDALPQILRQGRSQGIAFGVPSHLRSTGGGTRPTTAATGGSKLNASEIVKSNNLHSLLIRELGSGKTIASHNASQAPASPGSTIKLIIADLVTKSIESGKIKLKDVVTIKAGEVAEGSKFKAGEKKTVSTLLNEMLKNSDNTATNALINLMGGTSAVTAIARRSGYTGTNIQNLLSIPGARGFTNTSTAQDVSLAMQRLWNNKNVNLRDAIGSTRDFNYQGIRGGKIGNNSRVMGNVGLIEIDGKLYMVTMFANVNGNDVKNRRLINNATNQVGKALRGGSTQSGSQSSRAAQPTGRSTASSNIPKTSGLKYIDNNFLNELRAMSARLGMNPAHLLAVMMWESELNPAARNPHSSATGLIQFMPATARGLGTNIDALRGMTATQQLPFVEKYFQPHKGNLGTLRQVLSTIFTGKPNSPDHLSDGFVALGDYERKILQANKQGNNTLTNAERILGMDVGSSAAIAFQPVQRTPLKITPDKVHHNKKGGYTKGSDGEMYLDDRRVEDFVLTDAQGKKNVAVTNAVAGIVQKKTDDPDGYGNYVNIVDKSGKVLERIAHLENFDSNLKDGQFIPPGTTLGIQGKTGDSSDIHVHWEGPAELYQLYREALRTGDYSKLFAHSLNQTAMQGQSVAGFTPRTIQPYQGITPEERKRRIMESSIWQKNMVLDPAIGQLIYQMQNHGLPMATVADIPGSSELAKVEADLAEARKRLADLQSDRAAATATATARPPATTPTKQQADLDSLNARIAEAEKDKAKIENDLKEVMINLESDLQALGIGKKPEAFSLRQEISQSYTDAMAGLDEKLAALRAQRDAIQAAIANADKTSEANSTQQLSQTSTKFDGEIKELEGRIAQLTQKRQEIANTSANTSAEPFSMPMNNPLYNLGNQAVWNNQFLKAADLRNLVGQGLMMLGQSSAQLVADSLNKDLTEFDKAALNIVRQVNTTIRGLMRGLMEGIKTAMQDLADMRNRLAKTAAVLSSEEELYHQIADSDNEITNLILSFQDKARSLDSAEATVKGLLSLNLTPEETADIAKISAISPEKRTAEQSQTMATLIGKTGIPAIYYQYALLAKPMIEKQRELVAELPQMAQVSRLLNNIKLQHDAEQKRQDHLTQLGKNVRDARTSVVDTSLQNMDSLIGSGEVISIDEYMKAFREKTKIEADNQIESAENSIEEARTKITGIDQDIKQLEGLTGAIAEIQSAVKVVEERRDKVLTEVKDEGQRQEVSSIFNMQIQGIKETGLGSGGLKQLESERKTIEERLASKEEDLRLIEKQEGQLKLAIAASEVARANSEKDKEQETISKIRANQIRPFKAEVEFISSMTDEIGKLRQAYGMEPDREASKQNAIARQNLEYLERLSEIASMNIPDNEIEKLRANAEILNDIKLSNIAAEFSMMAELFKSATGSIKDSIKKFLEGTGSINDLFDGIFKGIIDGLYEMSSKGLAEEIKGGLARLFKIAIPGQSNQSNIVIPSNFGTLDMISDIRSGKAGFTQSDVTQQPFNPSRVIDMGAMVVGQPREGGESQLFPMASGIVAPTTQTAIASVTSTSSDSGKRIMDAIAANQLKTGAETASKSLETLTESAFSTTEGFTELALETAQNVGSTITESTTSLTSSTNMSVLTGAVQMATTALYQFVVALQMAAAGGGGSSSSGFVGFLKTIGGAALGSFGSAALGSFGFSNTTFSPGQFSPNQFDLSNVTVGTTPISPATFAKGGLVGEINKSMRLERSLTARTPHLIVASEGERVLNHRETELWEKLQRSGFQNFADGGVVGQGDMAIKSRNNSTTINVPVSVNLEGDRSADNVDSSRLSDVVQRTIQETIRKEMRPGGSINRGNPYAR